MEMNATPEAKIRKATKPPDEVERDIETIKEGVRKQMKSVDIMPTKDNIVRSIVDNDLGRIEQVFYFAALLNEIEGPYSIAINAQWGEGKTFFVKQTIAVLDALNDQSDLSASERERIVSSINRIIEEDKTEYVFQPQLTVYYDAWACDNDCDPILSLIYEILTATSTELDSAREDVFHKIVQLAASVADAVTGIGFQSIVDSLKSLIEKPDPLEQIKKQRKLQELISEFLDTIHIEKGNRIVIFVDELDRCKPDYAVRFLERIKHFFTNENVTFVFSINRLELSHTIKQFYGTDFNADGYLLRFFDYMIDLPKGKTDRFYNSIGLNSNRYYFELMCKAVIRYFRFSYRDLARYYHACKVAAYIPTHNSNFYFSDGLKHSLYNIVPILIGLRTKDSGVYMDFINGKNPQPLIDVLESQDPYSEPFMEALLHHNETYDSDAPKNGRVTVTKGDKLKQYYRAVFVDGVSQEERIVGSLMFEDSTKTTLIRISNGLTPFADRK